MQVNWKSGGQPEVQVWLCLGQIIKPSGYDFLIRYEGGRVALSKQQGYLCTLKMSLHLFWISFFSFVASSLSLFASSNEAWSFFLCLYFFLSLVFRSCTVMCLDVLLSIFILLRFLCSTSQICGLVSFISFGKSFHYMLLLLHFFFSPFPSWALIKYVCTTCLLCSFLYFLTIHFSMNQHTCFS